jgi:uncharacterized protein (DUF736 family)
VTAIGRIQCRQTRNGDILEGHVATLLHSFRFHLIRAPKSDNPNAPSYRIVTWSNAGIEVVIGAAWIKTIKRGDRAGEEFLTLTFDDPSFSRSLNVAAFKNGENDDYEITYRRRQERAT